MSTCSDKMTEILPEFVRGLLDPDDMIKVADHLDVCRDCALAESVLRELENEPVPQPPPWFWSSLPGKVTADIEARKKRAIRVLGPVWAAGLSAAALAALLFMLPASFPGIQVDFSDLAEAGSTGSYYMGLEEELLAVSETDLDQLESPLINELAEYSDVYLAATGIVMDGLGYETMDEDTIRMFEGYVEEMTPEEVRKRVMS